MAQPGTRSRSGKRTGADARTDTWTVPLNGYAVSTAISIV